jgi:hypothetical protein
MKKLLVLVFVLSSVVIAQAQVQVALGLKAGVNVSKLNTDEVESSSITAFHGGAFALFKFTVIGIQPELLFSQQGTSIDDVDFGEGDLKMSYMTVPVMVKFYFPGGFNLQAGPQFGFLNSAEFDGQNVEDSFKSSDVTANVGLAWDAPFGLVLDARYNIGLSDVSDDNQFGSVKGNTFQFSLGYKIFKFGN